jgi:putative ABC transport system permease protein
MPESFDEIVLFVSRRNEITDFAMFSLGLKDPAELDTMMRDISLGKETGVEQASFDYDEILGLTFKLVPNTDCYQKLGGNVG